MIILQYIGKADYIDEKGRFIAAPLSRVEFEDAEAKSLLEGGSKQWQSAELSGQSTKQAAQAQRSQRKQ